MSHRKLKKEVLALLRCDDLDRALEALCRRPARRVVNPLFGLLCHAEAIVRWRAVTAMGAVVSALAEDQPESARVVMRRFLWTLNDESGGIGWGSPESMGEIMARSALLADEYACMLISYADPAGNYLEHPVLQYGVIWALGRLGRARPRLMRPAARLLIPWLHSEDPNHRGLAAWAACPLKCDAFDAHLTPLQDDPTSISLYACGRLHECTIGALARCARDACAAV